MELEKARLDAHWKTQQAVKVANETKPVYDKRGKSLIEITEHKIADAKQKLAVMEEKLAWLKSNPQVPVQNVAVPAAAPVADAANPVDKK